MDGFRFPEGFELGVASAATQIEGGDIQTNWHRWYEEGHIKDGSSPAVTTMHWDKWKEDDKLMADMGIKHARIGIEWARIEPEKGQFDKNGIKHYVNELKYMRKLGIEPLVTLHHFSNPTWFDDLGGWENYKNVKYWLKMVKVVVEAFGPLCNQYITINEPNVYAMSGWFDGTFPPGKKDMKLYIEVLSNLAAAHVHAYGAIHKLNPSARVSAAIHVCDFVPLKPYNGVHRGITLFAEQAFQTAISEAMAKGVVKFPLKKKGKIQPGEYCDFWGLNYYSRQTISGFTGGTYPGSKVNDLGWEIRPEGIASCAKKLYDILPRDIYITENGTCDNNDAFRTRFIYDHLKAVLNSRLPIKRYYHWCFVDNFEWSDGVTPRFGLVYNDYETQTRTVKRSGRFYSEMINARGCTQDMYNEYVDGVNYKEQ